MGGGALIIVGNRQLSGVVAGLGLLLMPAVLLAQGNDGNDPDGPPVLSMEAARLVGSITIDGDLSDVAWQAASPATGFIQQQPVEGPVAEEQTEVRVLFGTNAIYVAARMFDSNPSTIANQLVRRDGDGQFDHFQIAFDPNLDQRTGYLFQVSAANVQSDAYFHNDSESDGAWDAVWTSAVARDAEGWTVELRIPLSQIRYESSEGLQTWGVDFARMRVASNERSFWSLLSQLRSGIVSQFGVMTGVPLDRPSRRIEIRPYVLSAAHTGTATAGDPFFDGREGEVRSGFEVSYGIGANFTLDATVSPDFGQVESDPAVINLTAFETFLEERRPFFVEDARIFDFDLSGRENKLFYSRRMGRAPHGGSPDEASFTDSPDHATILGAAKLSGRTSGGLSVGILGALTGREQGKAYFAEDDRFENFLVEPRAAQGVVRLQQDFNEGASHFGGIFTALNRSLPGDGSFDFLAKQAYNAGLDFEVQWGNRAWAFFGFFAGSHVRGNSEAITRIQRSSNHYFQRPDATRLELDSMATAMTGAEWRLTLERRRGEHWTGAVWAAEVTPGFETNDMGFSRSAERLDGGIRIAYRDIVPGNVFRNYNLRVTSIHNFSHDAFDDLFSASNWNRAQTSGSFSLRGEGQLLNWWEVESQLRWSPETMSRTATRGGPLMVNPGNVSGTFQIGSDPRNPLSLELSTEVERGADDSGRKFGLGFEVSFRPSPRMEFRVEPKYETETTAEQYVTSTDVLDYAPTFGRRYIFADLERETVSMETRFNVSFSPNLTLELFVQPLIASGNYVSYKQLVASEAFDFTTFSNGDFVQTGEQVVCGGGRICQDGDTQHVDLDGNGTADFEFSDRDFNQRSLIGNAVVRWEYRPGSTIFFVWQRSQIGVGDFGDFAFGRDVGALFDVPAENRFIVKVNYWLGM